MSEAFNFMKLSEQVFFLFFYVSCFFVSSLRTLSLPQGHKDTFLGN